MIHNEHSIDTLVGATIVSCKDENDSSHLVLKTQDSSFVVEHIQQTNESVWIDNFIGDIKDIINQKIANVKEHIVFDNDTNSKYFIQMIITETGKMFGIKWAGDKFVDNECFNISLLEA